MVTAILALRVTDSLSSFWDAVQAFGETLGSVGLRAVAVALAFQTVSLALRSVAWRNIIGAGLGRTQIPIAPIAGGLVAGAGFNGILPARGGDAFKVFLVHGRVPGTTYPMLTASLVAETFFNAVMGISLLVWAWVTGRLPSAPELPGMSAFEISWAAQHPAQAAGIVILIVTVVASVVISHRAWIVDRWDQVQDGVRILRSPRDYLLSVVAYQAPAWIAQVVAAWFFLEAFSIPPTASNALLVVLVQGMGSVLLVTPGGIGPKQALTVVLLSGQASPSAILAFSAGMELILIGFQLIIGVVAAGKLLGAFQIRSALASARRIEAEDATKVMGDHRVG